MNVRWPGAFGSQEGERAVAMGRVTDTASYAPRGGKVEGVVCRAEGGPYGGNILYGFR